MKIYFDHFLSKKKKNVSLLDKMYNLKQNSNGYDWVGTTVYQKGQR